MASDIGVFIEGDRKVTQRFDEFPRAVHGKLLAKITGITAQLEARLRVAVPKKTGRLASEVTATVRDTPERITGTVGFSAEFAKAGALEYGGTGKPFKVAAHQMRLEHVFANRLNAPLTVMVDAHSHATHLIAKRFERDTLGQMRGEIENELREVVDESVAEASQ